MNRTSIQILLLGADPDRAESIREALARSDPPFDLVHETDLETGLSIPGSRPVDLVMLDLDLLSDDWLYALVRVHETVPDLPVVVLADESTDELARKAVEIGAHDYVRKEDLRDDVLLRSVRYALERARLLSALGRGPVRSAPYDDPYGRAATVTAEVYGSRPLRVALPDLFDQLVSEYGGALDEALQQQVYRVELPVSERLRALASRLGFVKARPRDVVELHYATLKAKSGQAPPGRLQAYVEEGRIRLLELMGNLASYYRSQSLGTWPQREEGKREPD